MLSVAVTASNVRITNNKHLIEKYAVIEEHDFGLRKIMKILNQDIRCWGRNSKGGPPKCNLEILQI